MEVTGGLWTIKRYKSEIGYTKTVLKPIKEDEMFDGNKGSAKTQWSQVLRPSEVSAVNEPESAQW